MYDVGTAAPVLIQQCALNAGFIKWMAGRQNRSRVLVSVHQVWVVHNFYTLPPLYLLLKDPFLGLLSFFFFVIAVGIMVFVKDQNWGGHSRHDAQSYPHLSSC